MAKKNKRRNVYGLPVKLGKVPYGKEIQTVVGAVVITDLIPLIK